MFYLIVDLLRIIEENTLVIILLSLLYYLIVSVSLYFIYKKTFINTTKAIIPIYNVLFLLKLVKLPSILALVVFIPYINFLGIIFGSIFINCRLANLLKMSYIKKLGLIVCPVLFFPIVALGDVELGELKESGLLIKPKEKKVEEEKEFVLDVPSYEVADVDISKKAIGASQFIDNKMYISKEKKSGPVDLSDDAKDSTFDYDSLYK